jgi:monoamine oxidase
LCVSYTWAKDAVFFENISDEKAFEIIILELAELHDMDPAELQALVVKDNLLVQRWSKCEKTLGSFALFAPTQLNRHLVNLMTPENGLYFAGEHTDIHHAWIVGSMNSAARSVLQLLSDIGDDKARQKVLQLLGPSWINADTAADFVSE